jgi:hypothetical protein
VIGSAWWLWGGELLQVVGVLWIAVAIYRNGRRLRAPRMRAVQLSMVTKASGDLCTSAHMYSLGHNRRGSASATRRSRSGRGGGKPSELKGFSRTPYGTCRRLRPLATRLHATVDEDPLPYGPPATSSCAMLRMQTLFLVGAHGSAAQTTAMPGSRR